MKKVCIIFIALALASCSKDDEVDPRESMFLENIIGSWIYETIKVDGQTYLYPHVEGCEKDRFHFWNSEGNEFDFMETIILECPICECTVSATNLEWELKGDIINLYFGNQLVLSYKIIEVNETIFTYQVEVDYDEDGDKDMLEITGIKYDPYN